MTQRQSKPNAPELSPAEARQGSTPGRMRYVLGVSLALVVIAFAILYFVHF